MTSKWGKSAAVLAAAVMLVAIVSPPARAADTLPLPDYGDMVVDQAHSTVFISGGPTSNGIAVTSHSGRLVKTIAGQSGATGLALSADGRSLYAALAAGDAISVIDTKTLTETARYPTGAQTCPTHLAVTGTLVWFGYGCDDTWTGRIGRLDPTATPPVTLDQQGDARFQRAPYLASSGAAGSPVVAGQLSMSLAAVHVYSVADGGLVPGASGDVAGSNLVDLAVSPDGSTVYAASGSRTAIEGFATADLARRGAYPTGAYPAATAATADGRHLAAGAFTSRPDAIFVYAIGGVSPVREIGLDGAVLADRGLAFAADTSRLFAVIQGAADTRPRLIVVTRPAG